MASIIKRRNSQYWHAVFRVPQDNGKSKVVFRSTKKTLKREATQAAVDMERAARAEAGADDEKSRRILAVVTRATEDAARGVLTAKKGRELIREVVKISTGQDVRSYTVKEWIDDWIANQAGLAKSSCRAYRTATNNFIDWLGERRDASIETITGEDMRAFRDWLLNGMGKGKKVSKSTVQGKHKCIKSVFADALSVGIVGINPSATMKAIITEPKLARKPFTKEEVNRLILHAKNDEWRRFITLATFTGLRMGDCMDIVWQNIKLEEGVIELVPKKTERINLEVKIPIHPTLAVSLYEVPEAKRTKGKVFPEIAKITKSGSSGMSTKFIDLMHEAKVSRGKSQTNGERTNYERSFHSLRHTLTTWLAKAQVPPEIRMKITGHKSKEIHAIYTHLDQEQLSTAINSIPLLTTE